MFPPTNSSSSSSSLNLSSPSPSSLPSDSSSSTPHLLHHNFQPSYSLSSLPNNLPLNHSPHSINLFKLDNSILSLNPSSSSPPHSPLSNQSPLLISPPNLSSPPATLISNSEPTSHSSIHFPPLDSPSSIIECLGSPRSLSSWHLSDLPSHPGSSFGGASQFGDRDLSDPDHDHDLEDADHASGRGPLTDGEANEGDPHPPRSSHDPHHPGSRELLTAITGHLVMPRLSMTASASGPSSCSPSVRSHSSASLHKQPLRDRLRHVTHFKPALNRPRTRVLVVGDAQAAHGLGTLDGSLAPFVDKVERASELVAEFKITDPLTHHVLLEHVAAPFSRLQILLDDGVLEKQTATSTGLADLASLVDGWVEKEAYLVALVEMPGFPAAPETIDFILALSRLVPTLPFISTALAPLSASDAHAVYTRQLVAKRVRHLGVPRPEQPFGLPERDECVRRTRRCCLDWLAVEAAARAAPIPDAPILGSSEDAEPDRWSEKVYARRQALWRNAHGAVPPRTPVAQLPQRPYSRDPLGLPSLSCVFQLGIRQARQAVGRILEEFAWRILSGGGVGGAQKVGRRKSRSRRQDEMARQYNIRNRSRSSSVSGSREEQQEFNGHWVFLLGVAATAVSVSVTVTVLSSVWGFRNFWLDR